MANLQMFPSRLFALHLSRIGDWKVLDLLGLRRTVYNHQSSKSISQTALYELHRKEDTERAKTKREAICGQLAKRLTWFGRFRNNLIFGWADARLRRDREGLVLYDYKCEAIRNLKWE